MDLDEFSAFLEAHVRDYTKDLVRVAGMTREAATAKALRDTEGVREQGATGEDNRVFAVEDLDEVVVGGAWIGTFDRWMSPCRCSFRACGRRRLQRPHSRARSGSWRSEAVAAATPRTPIPARRAPLPANASEHAPVPRARDCEGDLHDRRGSPHTWTSVGCAVVSTSCDDLAFRTIALDAPIGDRRIYAATFPQSA